MINKINNPIHLTLVKETKEAENDPGASSGSGLFYQPPPEQSEEKEEEPKRKRKLAPVSELQKSGMTEVVLDFYEHKSQEHHSPQAGLTSKYQVDSGKSKGLLLNKKAE